MSGINISVQDVEEGKPYCTKAIASLQTAIDDLERMCNTAGREWKDSKFTEFRDIIGTTTRALNNPIARLNASLKKLDELIAKIEEYEKQHMN